MGTAMARNMQRHLAAKNLPPLRVFNRTASRMDALISLGAIPGESESEVAKGCDVIFISVSSDSPALLTDMPKLATALFKYAQALTKRVPVDQRR